MQKLRKFLVSSVMVLTALAMSGLVAPSVEAAASAGDLIKMAGNSSVYYLGADGKRYVFPNEATYFSWYSDFSGVVTIPAAELQSYALGGNVTMRPGTKLVKITTDPSVYAVEPNGTLRKIQSEAQAAALYGTDWAKRVVDVPDAFFVNYTVGAVLPDGAVPAGTLVKASSGSDVYYYDGTNYRMIANEAAFNANRFKWSDVITVSSVTAGGTAITGAETALVNTAQGGGSAPVSTGSGVMVSLSSSTPAAKTVPSNATGVVMASYNFTASNDGSVVLENVVVKRTGVGTPSEISKVYLYEGATRLTNGRTVSSSDNTATFSAVNYTIPAGTTKTLSVVADVASDAVGNHAFGIESASMVSAGGANVSGAFPVTGNTMSFSSTSVGLTDVEGNNTYTVKAGETNVEVGRFTIYVSNDEDATINSLTLYNGGRDVLSNLKLYRGSDLVATGVKNGNYFVFTLANPISVVKGENVAFNVMGDIVNARDNDIATLTVRYNTDLQVKGKTYGYNLKPTLDEGTGVSMIEELGAQKQTINVEAGQVTLSFNGPTTSNVAKNSKDVVLMDFSIAAQSAVDVEKVGLVLKDSDTTDDDDLANLEIVCGSAIMNEWADPGDATTNSLTDTSIWNVAAGETKNCQVRVDVENIKDANDQISVDLAVDNWIFKDANTGDTISDVVPSADLVGNTMTVVSASLIGSMSSSPASQTWVKGSTIEVNGYNFVSGDAKDVKVTAISLLGYIDADASGTFGNGIEGVVYVKDVLSTIELYDGTTKIGTTKTVATDGSVTFNTLNWNIPAGATKRLTVKGLTSNNAPYGDTDVIKFTVTSVTAEYDNGTGLTPNIDAIDGEADITIKQTITGAGTLAISTDANNPSADILVMGAQNQEVLKVKYTSTREDFKIEKLDVKANAADLTNFTSVSLSYTNSSGATETKTGYFDGSGNAYFSGLDVLVEKDDSAVVTVVVNLNDSTGGASSGALNAGITVDAEGNFRAVGQASGEVKVDAGDDQTSAVFHVRKTKPTFTYVSGVVGGQSANQEVLRFSITADQGEDVVVDKLDFTPYGTAAIAAVAKLYESGNTTAIADTGAGTDYLFEAADFTNATGITVTKGQTKTFYVTTDTTSALTDKTFSLGLGAAVSDINWTDGDDATIDGTYVKTLPISGSSMKY